MIQDIRKKIKTNATHEQIYEEFEKANLYDITDNLENLHTFRQKIADIFGLADKNNDKALYQYENELEEFWDVIEHEIIAIDDLDTQNQARNWQMSTKEKWKYQEQAIEFHDIQKFLWTGEKQYEFNIERIRNNYFKKRVPCSFFCCLCKCLRSLCTKKRVKGKDPEVLHFGPVKAILIFYGQFNHSLDLFTDALLANEMYWLSKDNSNKEVFADNYNIAFIMISMAIFGPYIIQYSSLMNAIHNKGFFKEQKFKEFWLIKKAFLYFAFTAFGLIIMPLIDILLKIESLFNVLAIPLCCRYGNKNRTISKRIHILFEDFFEYFFNLNAFELENFEKQKKYTQVLFEDMLMFALQVLIYAKVVRVPLLSQDHQKIKGILKKNALFLSFITTVNSILTTWVSLWTESTGLKESQMEYIMLSMKAKQDWVPYGIKLMQNELGKDIDYSMIEFKYPALTDATGLYKSFIYQFSEESLKKLTAQLDQAHAKRLNQQIVDNKLVDCHQLKQNKIKKYVPRLKFGFSLFQTTIHDFCNFIDRNFIRDPQFVWQKIDLKNIDWEQMIKNSKNMQKDLKQPKTDSGKSLLQVCIENENTVKNSWQLKSLMKLLLQLDQIDLNIYDDKEEFNLLSFCYENKKHQAFEMMIQEHPNKIDINLVNIKDNSTIYGILFYQNNHKYYEGERYYPKKKLELLLKYHGKYTNKNIPQIAIQGQSLNTPLYYFIKHTISVIGNVNSIDDMIKHKEYQRFFGDEKIIPTHSIEIQQLFSLFFDGRGKKAIAEQFLKRAQENEPDKCLYKHLGVLNDDHDSFMHLMDCRYAPPFWKPFIKPKDGKNVEEILKELVMNQLQKMNRENQTPILKHLERSQSNYNFVAIPKLFQQDLVNENSFQGQEDKIINGFLKFIVEGHTQNKFVDQNKIDKTKFFKAFQEPFQSYKQMKMRFNLTKNEEIFKQYLLIDKYEELQEQQQQSSNDFNLEEIFEELMKEKDYEEAQPVTKNMHDKQINASYAQLLEKKFNEPQIQHIVLVTFLSGFIEISSVFDFLSDVYVLYQLSRSTDTAWFSFTLFTMICPYYTVYSSLMTFKINDIRKIKQQGGGFGTIKNLIMISPIMLIVMIFLDIIFMLINSIIYLFMFLIILTRYGKQAHQKYEEFWDYFFKKCFGMSVMDVRGFKCQRTILQLQLESIPQIFFQWYLLYRIPYLKANFPQNFTLDIDLNVIEFSICMALIHFVFEMINLYFESKTSKSAFIDYMVSCYSARQGWIPQKVEFFKNQLNHQEQQNLDDSVRDIFVLSEHSALDGSQWGNLKNKKDFINFDDQSMMFCGGCIGFSVDFELSDNSVEYLIQIISDLPYILDPAKQKTLMLGACIQHVKLDNILQLLHLAYQKIKLLFVDEILRNKMKQDTSFMSKIRYPVENHTDPQEEYYIVDMVRMSYIQVVHIMIELEANLNIKSKKKVYYKSDQFKEDAVGTKLFKIAHKIGNKDMLSLFMAFQEQNGSNLIHETMQANDIINHETKTRLEAGFYLKQPLMFLDAKMIMPWDMMNSFIFNLSRVIKKCPHQAKLIWNVMFGCYVPLVDYKNYPQLVSVYEMIHMWVEEYPERLKLAYHDEKQSHQLEIQSQFLCQFVLIRKSFYVSKCDKISDNYYAVIDLSKDLQNIKCNLDDIVNVYRLHHGKINKSWKLENYKRCDRIIKSMGFDKQWSYYYHHSRQGLSKLLKHDQLVRTVKCDWRETIPADVKAIKELRIYKIDPQDEPKYLKFYFWIPHYKGWFDTEVSSSEFWTGNTPENDELLIQVVNFHSTNYQILDDFRFRLMNLLIKNQLRGGDIIKVEIKNNKKQLLKCRLEIEYYLDIQDAK